MWERCKRLIYRVTWIRSIRFYIFLAAFIMGAGCCVAMQKGILSFYENRAVDLRIQDTKNQFMILSNHLVAHNYMRSPYSESINAQLEQMADIYNGRVLVIDDNCKVVKDTYGLIEGKTMIDEAVLRCFRAPAEPRYFKERGLIELTVPIRAAVAAQGQTGDNQDLQGKVLGVLYATVSTDSIRIAMEQMNRSAALLQIILLLLTAVCSIAVSGLLVRPLHLLASQIGDVRDGFSDETLSSGKYAETEQIASAFNEVLSRMRVIDGSRQEFVANVSHELKTPLASMKVLADSLNQQEDVPAEIYREFMQDIAEEMDHENAIINDLLMLVKLDKNAAVMNISTVNVDELLEQVLKGVRPIARRHNVDVIYECARPVSAEADAMKLSRIFTNLLENAIKYNRENGWVKVTLDADHQFFTVVVEDSGIGIPKEHWDHIFERFYRVDKSHSREIGGNGLGLAITRSAVVLHRGTIRVSSVEGEGTAFTVRIPLTYVSQEGTAHE